MENEQEDNEIKLMAVHQMSPSNAIRKANSLIEGNYRMNQPESKIMETILSIMDANNTELNYIEIETRKLCEFAHVNLRELKEFTLSMVKRELVFTGTDEDGNFKEIQTTWLDSAVYYPSRGIVRLRLSEELKPYLLGMWRSHIPYTEFSTGELISVTYYTKRIYEIACQYKKIGRRPPLSISRLRHMLGIPDDKYKQFSSFRERILDAAVVSIENNKEMPYAVSYQLKKSGRSFDSIEFFVKKKIDGPITDQDKQKTATGKITKPKTGESQKPISKMTSEDYVAYLLAKDFSKQLIDTLDDDQKRYIIRMIDNKINIVVLRNALITHGFAYVKANNEIALDRMKKNGKNYGALFFAAIKNDYAGTQKISKQAKNQREIAHKMTAAELKLQFDRENATPHEKITGDDATEMSDFEIMLMNNAIKQHGTVHFGTSDMIFQKFCNNKNERIRKALEILESGTCLPVNFFKKTDE
jgi:plasmid replication initiation protein